MVSGYKTYYFIHIYQLNYLNFPKLNHLNIDLSVLSPNLNDVNVESICLN